MKKLNILIALCICFNLSVVAQTNLNVSLAGLTKQKMQTPYKIQDGLITEGPQKGQQLFGNFIFDGPDWGINSANVVIRAPRRWTAESIIDMRSDWKRNIIPLC